MRRVSRLLSCVVLGLALFQAVGSRLPGVFIACLEACPDDDEGGACPVACDCACRAPHRVPLPEPLLLPEPAVQPASFAAAVVEAPAAPDPRALLHVPRALLG